MRCRTRASTRSRRTTGSGFEDDERDFRIGANILAALGFARVRLMTNNPAKVPMMRACGLEVVERVPLKVGRTRFNADYLSTKAARAGTCSRGRHAHACDGCRPLIPLTYI